MAKKVTFQTIADELNVSKGLVSLAMRNKYGVSEEMRSKIVLKAIELGYEFKQNMQKQKKNITLLVKNMGILNEDFWRRCILGIETECANENVGFTILGWMSLNDGEDRAHWGFAAFNELLDKYHPKYFVHGHVHLNYGHKVPRLTQYGQTQIINAYERTIFEYPGSQQEAEDAACGDT